MNNESLVLLTLCGVAFAGGGIYLSQLIGPSSKNSQKGEAYECGIPTTGPSWIQFNVGYYLFALIFLVFDVEIVFLFPWAAVVKEVGMIAFYEIVVFLLILFLGLIYAWKKGALKWV